MNYKFGYKDDVERTTVLTQNSNLRLVEEQNHLDGNFLIFTDVVSLDTQIQQLQDQLLLSENNITGGIF